MATTIRAQLREKWHVMQRYPHDPEWDNREAFYLWCIMSGYAPGLHLHKIDPTKLAGPDNCEWQCAPEDIENIEDQECIKRWNHTVNVLRRAAGLPLFPE